LEQARADLYAQLAEAAPVRETDGSLPVHDQAAVEITARALARYRQIDDWLCEQGDDLESDTVHRAHVLLNGASKTLADLLDKLGMSPRSRAALGLDLKRAQAFDLAQHWAEEDAKDA
jgi:hypothetical protein